MTRRCFNKLKFDGQSKLDIQTFPQTYALSFMSFGPTCERRLYDGALGVMIDSERLEGFPLTAVTFIAIIL